MTSVLCEIDWRDKTPGLSGSVYRSGADAAGQSARRDAPPRAGGFPLTVPPVHPRGIGAVFGDADEVAALARLEHQLQVQVRVPVGPPRMRSSPRARRATPPDSHVSTRSITQRELIRKALADCPPVGQKTVRGTLTNDMMRDADAAWRPRRRNPTSTTTETSSRAASDAEALAE